MDKLSALRIYRDTYRTHATQLRTSRLAREWMETMPGYRTASRAELEAHAAQSAAWASAGHMPAAAAALIAQGLTPETVTELEQIDDPDEESRAMEVIESGTVVDPRRVRQRVDPDDPTHIIVDIGD